ncbi:protein trichome birefringence-like 14 isoform X1 [Musa acuminata AAA Group]|uniref:(wild Malaysian banana) hypothetical protein n=2 Tax=Musa acuminata TaxID=4641 RepID=A0A804JV09_MUSAM|nr:PREDICTED: protein trichome birefringence-like 14 isoform X1 [Musa acuminata subsp. malaccensis]XP_018684221.1 PREDICTED: protein trichome birefringence-like 14 isoform X1 [Musa acuminata subsp. malaccensis]XP_018684222.1 PREDICTED: protein trichome birefringence-like 14 isoform X1 [Musa acuminata subsp. malaccensis]XP_018684223.1 PREDICTED: protein trichome birefringence-like 14 isoform X1 [Musa acuminata subsp. malaccensis]CAG1856371.1 unnamed protein product [Musa acuminata subsp. malacce
MQGMNINTVRGNKISLALIILICTTLVIWACNKVAILGIPHGQLDILSPVVPLRRSMNSTDGPNQHQSADEDLSVVEKVEINPSKETKPILSLSPIGSPARNLSREGGLDTERKTIPLMNVCNYAKGKWVADNRRPLYSGHGCKQWLSPMWACRLMKRTDFSYESFRWQPQGCEMPEFSGSKFLKRMQNRTIALVGDSLGRQQFQSLMCMITGGRKNPRVKDVGKEYGFTKARNAIRPSGWAYRFPETNTTILYHWSASLCELEPLNVSDPATNYAMHLDRPANFLRKYLHRFDVLVLNTGHHWNREKFRANGWEMYVDGKKNTKAKLAAMGDAKNLTIHNVIKWLDSRLPHLPHLKAFLRASSPRHFVNGEWNSGGSCDNTVPLSVGSEVSQDGSGDPVAEAAVRGTEVKLLDITALSLLRDEGHISRYGIKASQGRHDCLHWCLPGVPDTWNEILYSQI